MQIEEPTIRQIKFGMAVFRNEITNKELIGSEVIKNRL
jgi:hypothetical protein